MKKTLVKNRVIAIWGISLAGAALQWILFPPFWETNDDFFMGNLTSGAFGESTPFTVHPHHFLGGLLQLLYRLMPSVSWVGVVWELMVFLSFTAILWSLWQKAGEKKGTGLWFLFLVMFGYPFYTQVNYTRVSCIAAAVGYLLIFCGLDAKNRIATGAGIFLCWAGYMLREESWWLATALAGGVGLAELLWGYRLRQGLAALGRILKSKTTYFAAFSILFLGVFALYGLEEAYINSSPERQYFSQFHSIRIRLMDYPVKQYEEIQRELEQVEITKEDYLAFTSQLIHYDPENFTMEAMETMAALQESSGTGLQGILEKISQNLNPASLIPALKQLIKNRIFENTILCFLLVLLLATRKRWFLLAWQLAMLLALNWYLVSAGRNPERVLESICGMVAMFVLGTAVFRSEKMLSMEKMRPVQKGIALVCVLLLAAVNARLYFDPQNYGPRNPTQEMVQSQADIERLAEKEYYYICDISCDKYLMVQVGIDGLNTLPFDARTRFIPVGGWTVYHPVYLNQLEQAGIWNPYRELFSREDVFLIDQYEQGNTFRYLEQAYPQYMENATWSVCDRIGEGGYVLGFASDLGTVTMAEQTAKLELQVIDVLEEDLLWLEGSWQQELQEDGYYLSVSGETGQEKSYRILPEGEDGSVRFEVGIPRSELSEGTLEIAVLKNREQPILVAQAVLESAG